MQVVLSLGERCFESKVDSLKMFYYFTEKKAQNPDAPSIPPKTISPPKVNPPVNGKILRLTHPLSKSSLQFILLTGGNCFLNYFSFIYCLPLIMVSP